MNFIAFGFSRAGAKIFELMTINGFAQKFKEKGW
jgi:hypothetical protein